MADQEQGLRNKILEVLKEADGPLTPQEISHRVGFLKPHNQACKVNPSLYALLEKGEIEKHASTNGRKPNYSLPKTGSETTEKSDTQVLS